MRDFFLIFLGGGLGSVLRFLLHKAVENRNIIAGFPLGTLSVNIIGSFLIGIAVGYLEGQASSHWMRFLFIAGFCGGFTTFSTFSYDILILLKNGSYLYFAIYALISFLICLIAIILGVKSAVIFR